MASNASLTDPQASPTTTRRVSLLQWAIGLLVYSFLGSIASGLLSLAGIAHHEGSTWSDSLNSLSDPFVVDVFGGCVLIGTMWSWLWALVLLRRSGPGRNILFAAGAIVAIVGVLAVTVPTRFVLLSAIALPPVVFMLVALGARRQASLAARKLAESH